MRFGGAKEESMLQGRALIDHVIARAAPMTQTLAISRAAGAAPTERGLPVLVDRYREAGPLAGLHAGLCWAASLPNIDYLATFACDTPFFPDDLVSRLHGAGAAAALPRKAGRIHAAFGLWSVGLLAPLARALDEGARAMTAWALANGAASVDLDDGPATEFFNINTRADKRALEAMLKAPAGAR